MKFFKVYVTVDAVDDLKIDASNYGTIIAGITVLNGPRCVRILNLKVMILTFIFQILTRAVFTNSSYFWFICMYT